MAMRSHIRRACSRRSSGRPLAGRSIVMAGMFFCLAASSALSFAFRIPSTRLSTSRTLVRFSSSFALSFELVERDDRTDDRPLLNVCAREQTSGLRRMTSLRRRCFIEETVDDIDLLLERLERHQRFAELHFIARALCVPMILIDAIAEEDD